VVDRPKKIAVVVIHGMGEQIPMETLRGFVKAAWVTDTGIHSQLDGRPADIWFKPDVVTGSLELHRVTTRWMRSESNPKAKGRRVDFFEFYWADLAEGTTVQEVWDWLRTLLWRGPKRVPQGLMCAWLLLWAAAAVVTILSLLASLSVLALVLSPSLGGPWPTFFVAFAALAALVGCVMQSVISPYVGDVARYVRADPRNIAMRRAIRERGLKLLNDLHDSSAYNRIIIVAHSLGTIIAYDLVSFLWATRKKALRMNEDEDVFRRLRAVEKAAHELLAGATDAKRHAYREAQRELRLALRSHDGTLRKRKPDEEWLISDLVTLGSPLAHAAFLLAHDDDDLTDKKQRRLFPTNPPRFEKIESEQRDRIIKAGPEPVPAEVWGPSDGLFSYFLEKNYFLEEKRWSMHHAAPFAAVRWTNIHDPHRMIFQGDIISGPVAPVFGDGVRDIDLKALRGQSRCFSHTGYWKPTADGSAPHIDALRKAIDLLDRRDGEIWSTPAPGQSAAPAVSAGQGWAHRMRRRVARAWEVLTWEALKSLGRDSVNIIGFLVTVATFIGVIFVLFVLFKAVTARTISIAPLLVPQELEHSGTTSVAAAQRLRDALRRFGQRANAPVHGTQLAAYDDLPVVTVGHSLHDDLPDFVVPAVGLSVEGIAAYIRTYLGIYFGISDRRNISGEVTLLDNRLWLRLRLNGQAFYDSHPSGVEPNKVDQLFEMAANKVFEVTEPYWSAAALADKNPDRAVEVAEQFIAGCSAADAGVNCREPRQAARWHNLIGSILHDKGNLTKARAKYQEAIKADRGFAIAHSNLAGLLRELGDIDGAAAEYREAIKSDPHFAAAHFNLASALRAQQREGDAIAESKRAMTEYRDAIASNPSSVNTHADFGNALLAEGRSESDRLLTERKYEEAIEQYHRAVSLDPQNGAAHNGLGRALYQLSEALPARQQNRKDKLRQGAIDAFNQAVKLDPDFGEAYYNLGLVLRRKGGQDDKANQVFGKAKDRYELIVQRDRTHARVHRELGRLLHNSGDLDRAIGEFNVALDIEPDFTEAHRARGLALFYNGEFGKAASDLLSVAKASRDDNFYWMLWLYLAQRKSGDANALSGLKQRAEHVSRHVWPYAAIELFLGHKTVEQTQGAAGENADFECEAHFYVGEWQMLQKQDPKAAMDELKIARKTCRHEFIEYLGAGAELKRLSRNKNGGDASPRRHLLASAASRRRYQHHAALPQLKVQRSSNDARLHRRP
jgi:tetratricopeptide (TPR) repeat protein